MEQISQGSTETTAEDTQVSNTIEQGVTDFADQTQQAGDAIRQTTDTSNEPIIVLVGDSPMYISTGSYWNDPGANAVYPVTKSTSFITSPDLVNTNNPGTYVIDYSYTSPGGISALNVSRTVIVQ